MTVSASKFPRPEKYQEVSRIIAAGGSAVLRDIAIPPGYQALEIEVHGHVAGSAGPIDVRMTLNDAPANADHFSMRVTDAGGGSTTAQEQGIAAYFLIGYMPGTETVATVRNLIKATIYDYTQSKFFKTIFTEAFLIYNFLGSYLMKNEVGHHNWQKTDPITKITLTLSAGTWVADSYMVIRGVPKS